MEVSAAIVTRGDVDLEPCLEPIRAAGITDIVVWDNSVRQDMKVLGRYWAAHEAKHPTIYTQDDDAVCPVADILAAYQYDDLMVNVPETEDWPWLAWGAVFNRGSMYPPFLDYWDARDSEEDFYRWADVIFAELTPHRRVDLGHTNLPWATSPDRMYRQPDHYTSQYAVRDRCRDLSSSP